MNKFLKLTFVIFFFATALFVSVKAKASEYPSDYPVWSDSKDLEVVHIQRNLQGSGAVALNISYNGLLAKGGSVKVFVRIKYLDGAREALFDMTPTGSVRYAKITNGCLEGELGGCRAEGTATMKSLLQWACRMPMALNALDIEVAFTDGKGNWDSRNGANYGFHFKDFKF